MSHPLINDFPLEKVLRPNNQPLSWEVFRKMKRGFYMMRRAGPQYRKDDFAFFIDAISWDDEEYGDIFGPNKVNHAHHRLIRIRHFHRALVKWNDDPMTDHQFDQIVSYSIAESNLIRI